MNKPPSPDILEALRPIILADHVAVIGASVSPEKAGNRVIRNLRLHGYEGRISPVNPAGGEIEGLTCYPDVGAIPETVDCAIILIPPGAITEAVRGCAEAGVRSCVIGAVGFAELDTEQGRARQREVTDAALAAGMRVLGPNTNGFLNRDIGLALGYNTSHGEPIAKGVISVAAHTGALFTHFARILGRIKVGMSKFISVGNEADLSLLDCLEYFLEDENSQVIGLIIKGIRDGARFRALLERARAMGKPVVALKLGRSKAGAGASLAHATRLAGDGRAYDALFTLTGVATVPSIEAFSAGCALLAGRSAASMVGDQRLVCVSSSGAGAAMLADLAEARGIPMAVGPDGNWDEPVAKALGAVKTNQITHNPLDTGSLGRRERLDEVFEVLTAEGITGPTVGFTHTVGGIEADDIVARAFVRRKQRTQALTVMISPSGLIDQVVELYVDNAIPVFADTATAFDALKCHFATLPDGAAPDPFPPPLSARPSPTLERLAEARGSPVLDELASAEILREAGLAMVDSLPVASQAAAGKLAASWGYPVVLKGLAPGIAHKNDLGLVVPGIAGPRALDQAFRDIKRALKARGLGPGKVPLILQPMIPAKVELILGVTREVGLGHFALVGLGGIHAEVLDETVLLPLPIAGPAIKSRLDASRLGRLIAAIDVHGAGLMNDLLDALDALQGLIAAEGALIEAIDVNPFLLGAGRSVAVDALVVLARGSTDQSSP